MFLPPVPRKISSRALATAWLAAALCLAPLAGNSGASAKVPPRSAAGSNSGNAAGAKSGSASSSSTTQEAPTPAKITMVPCWKLRQDSRVTGPHTIYFNKTELKDYYERSGVITICRAPDWNVVSYQPITKRVYSQKLKIFAGYLQREIEIFSGKTFMDIPVKAGAKSKVYNQDATSYTSAAELKTKIQAQYRKGEVDGGTPSQVTVLALVNADCSEPINDLMCKIYGLPKVSGLPLKCDVLEVDLTNRNFLSTGAVTKTALPASEFELPSGLTKVNTMAEVVSQEDPNDKSGLFQLVEGDNPRQSPAANKARGR